MASSNWRESSKRSHLVKWSRCATPDEQKAYERLLQPGWGELWAGTASLGFAGTSGNARTLTFTTGVNAARVTSTDKTSIYFNTIKASALVNGTEFRYRTGGPRRDRRTTTT